MYVLMFKVFTLILVSTLNIFSEYRGDGVVKRLQEAKWSNDINEQKQPDTY